MAVTYFDVIDPLAYSFPRDFLTMWRGSMRRVRCFVVDADIGSWAGCAEPVDADPGAKLVVCEWVVVRPVVEFLVDPT